MSVNIGDEDASIVTNDLSVTGNRKITVNRTGTGRLILCVLDRLELAGSGSMKGNLKEKAEAIVINGVIMWILEYGNTVKVLKG